MGGPPNPVTPARAGTTAARGEGARDLREVRGGIVGCRAARRHGARRGRGRTACPIRGSQLQPCAASLPWRAIVLSSQAEARGVSACVGARSRRCGPGLPYCWPSGANALASAAAGPFGFAPPLPCPSRSRRCETGQDRGGAGMRPAPGRTPPSRGGHGRGCRSRLAATVLAPAGARLSPCGARPAGISPPPADKACRDRGNARPSRPCPPFAPRRGCPG